MSAKDFKGSHSLAYPDKGGDRARPSWERNTTCDAPEAEQRAQKAVYDREAPTRAEAMRRAYDRKQTKVQDS